MAWSLRGALRESSEAEGKPAKSWPAFIEGIGKFSKSVAYAVKHPLSLWPAEGKAKLRSTLEPVVRELWPEKFGVSVEK